MSTPTRTEYALLGLVAMVPRSGYDIKQLVEERLSHFWSESYGNIYPTLRRLTDRGWITKSEVEDGSSRTRHEYSITPSGRAALEAWFAKPVSHLRPRNELLLRIFFGRFGDPTELVRSVLQSRGDAADQLELLRSVQCRLDSDSESDLYTALTVDYGVRVLTALVEWSDATLERLESLQ